MPTPNDYFLGTLPYVQQLGQVAKTEQDEKQPFDPETFETLRAYVNGDKDAVLKLKLKRAGLGGGALQTGNVGGMGGAAPPPAGTPRGMSAPGVGPPEGGFPSLPERGPQMSGPVSGPPPPALGSGITMKDMARYAPMLGMAQKADNNAEMVQMRRDIADLNARTRTDTTTQTNQTRKDVAQIGATTKTEEGDKNRAQRDKENVRNSQARIKVAEIHADSMKERIKVMERLARASKDLQAQKAVLDFKAKLEGVKSRLIASKNQLGGALGSVPELDTDLGALDDDLTNLDQGVTDAITSLRGRMGSGGGGTTEQTRETEKVRGAGAYEAPTGTPTPIKAKGDVKEPPPQQVDQLGVRIPVVNENGQRGSVSPSDLEAWLKENPKRKRR